ncbi:MAG: DUF1269 domain-containing protein [Anaerolineae bacterium]|nr:DUF1269 domain-containing protein [Anaerolineae bacterium]
MTTLTVLKFTTARGAEYVLETLQRLQKQRLLILHDAALVTWPPGAKKPKTRHLTNLAGQGALDGAFWGLLFGLIFLIPIAGAALGAAAGAIAGYMTQMGVTDDFVKEMRQIVTEGTSALFLLTSEEVPDKIIDALRGTGLEVVNTNLSKEAEEKLRQAFASKL